MSIDIKRYYATHEEGTKFYELTSIRNYGSSTLIQRWGSVGKLGQTKVTRFDTITGSESELHKIKHAKEKRGYNFFSGYSEESCKTLDEATDFFRNAIGYRFDVTLFTDEARHRLHIASSLGPDGTLEAGGSDGVGVFDAKPLPELKRDEKWGSW